MHHRKFCRCCLHLAQSCCRVTTAVLRSPANDHNQTSLRTALWPRDGMMDQIERLLLVASGAELSPADLHVHAWTSQRTAHLGGVLQQMLRGYTEGAISVTTGLVTSISRFVLQARAPPRLAFTRRSAARPCFGGCDCARLCRSLQTGISLIFSAVSYGPRFAARLIIQRGHVCVVDWHGWNR